MIGRYISKRLAPVTMNAFLERTKRLAASKEPLVIVLGNESCDLDSAISALSLAYYYSLTPQNGPAQLVNRSHLIVPMLNKPRAILPTNTELTLLAHQHHIDLKNVVCNDEMPAALIAASQFILVDHHFNANVRERVIEVIDHRPFDSSANLPANIWQRIDDVGSCCTLIADRILEPKVVAVDGSFEDELLRLLYPVIVLDTVNFSPAADKARPLDFTVAERIEQRLGFNRTGTTRMFDELVAARSDVGQLNSYELLWKDLKVVTGQSGTVVTIPGLPISVQDYLNMPLAKESMMKFCKATGSDVVVLMGMIVTGSTVQRDLALINIGNGDVLLAKILERLHASDQLRLQEVIGEFHTAKVYRQLNIKASRKQLLPIVKSVLDEL